MENYLMSKEVEKGNAKSPKTNKRKNVKNMVSHDQVRSIKKNHSDLQSGVGFQEAANL